MLLAQKSHPDIQIKIISNGIDTRAFSPYDQLDDNDELVVVSTGRLIERKGYDILIKYAI